MCGVYVCVYVCVCVRVFVCVVCGGGEVRVVRGAARGREGRGWTGFLNLSYEVELSSGFILVVLL